MDFDKVLLTYDKEPFERQFVSPIIMQDDTKH